LAKLLLRAFQIYLDGLEVIFKEFPFLSRWRSGELGHKSIEFFDVRLSDCRGTFRVAIGNGDRKYPALAVFRNGSVLREFLSRRLLQSGGIDFLEIKPLDQTILDSAATKDSNKKSSRTLYPKEVSR